MKESKLLENIRRHSRGVVIKKIHGDMMQEPLPDVIVSSRKRGLWLVELKVLEVRGPRQLIDWKFNNELQRVNLADLNKAFDRHSAHCGSLYWAFLTGIQPERSFILAGDHPWLSNLVEWRQLLTVRSLPVNFDFDALVPHFVF